MLKGYLMELGREYRGSHFIRKSDLPEDLRNEITNWLNDDILIKIRTDEGLFGDCILVKDFQYWYENIYTPVDDLSESASPVVSKKRSIRFAFQR